MDRYRASRLRGSQGWREQGWRWGVIVNACRVSFPAMTMVWNFRRAMAAYTCDYTKKPLNGIP